MTSAHLDAVSQAHWQAYVRRARGPVVDEDDDDDFSLNYADVLLSPTDLPPPPTLPERDIQTLYSPYIVSTQDRRRVKVPWHAVIRDYTVEQRGIILDKNKDNVPDPCHVVVLMVRDAFGDAQHGWFLRLQSDPFLLRRISYGVAGSLLATLRGHELLKFSSLNSSLLDAYFADAHLDFEALLSLRFESFRSRYNRLAAPKKRKRTTKDCGARSASQRSKPASPDCMTRNGQCAVCLDEDVEVHATKCCGTAGATCSSCRAQLRHYCPICSRMELGGSYQCQACNKIVTLEDYGMPCSSCDKCVLCSGCYINVGECRECDMVCA